MALSKKLCARKYASGFTLIELLIVVTIIGILAALAYPSYTRYIAQTRRVTAESVLMQVASMQEKFFTNCSWYASSLAGPLNCGANAASGVLAPPAAGTDIASFYAITIGLGAGATAYADFTKGYVLTATPIGSQAGYDANCGNLMLDSNGQKSISGAGPVSTCWKR
jgi:type IV pilus assembly protein PilE